LNQTEATVLKKQKIRYVIWTSYPPFGRCPRNRIKRTEKRQARQNGVIERFFRSLKEKCTWQHLFAGFHHARRTIARWIDWYNTERPHQALGHLSPPRIPGSTTQLSGLTRGKHYTVLLYFNLSLFSGGRHEPDTWQRSCSRQVILSA
jgi:hypothetical protein